jgi:ribosomal protein S18 acetylase RimI-like enzyme
VRYATEADLSRVARIAMFVQRLHAERHPDLFVSPDHDAIHAFFREQVGRDGSHILVAEEDAGEVVGYAYVVLSERSDGAFLRSRRTLSFEHLAIAEDSLRRGYGTALIGAVHSLAAELGADDVELVVWSFNEHAVAAYEAAGYVTAAQTMRRSLPA